MKRRSLHLLTEPPNDWVKQILQAQRESGSIEVIEVDLSSADVEYGEVVEQIFGSDSISVW